MRYKAVIRMLDGAVSRGWLDADLRGQAVVITPGHGAVSAGHFYFESSDRENADPIRFDAVKAIYLNVERESDLNAGLRFFDSAPTPSFLWVRATLIDGEVLEGMVSNLWSALNSPLIALGLPDQHLEQVQALIPRSSIAECQIVATR